LPSGPAVLIATRRTLLYCRRKRLALAWRTVPGRGWLLGAAQRLIVMVHDGARGCAGVGFEAFAVLLVGQRMAGPKEVDVAGPVGAGIAGADAAVKYLAVMRAWAQVSGEADVFGAGVDGGRDGGLNKLPVVYPTPAPSASSSQSVTVQTEPNTTPPTATSTSPTAAAARSLR